MLFKFLSLWLQAEEGVFGEMPDPTTTIKEQDKEKPKEDKEDD